MLRIGIFWLPCYTVERMNRGRGSPVTCLSCSTGYRNSVPVSSTGSVAATMRWNFTVFTNSKQNLYLASTIFCLQKY